MSTLRDTLFVISLLAITHPATRTTLQGGPGPAKLHGPGIISSTRKSAVKLADNAVYTYEVELNHTSSFDTTIYVTDETMSAQPTVYTVVVPANQLSTTFEVVAAYPGDDTLSAYNANSTASLDITVL